MQYVPGKQHLHILLQIHLRGNTQYMKQKQLIAVCQAFVSLGGVSLRCRDILSASSKYQRACAQQPPTQISSGRHGTQSAKALILPRNERTIYIKGNSIWNPASNCATFSLRVISMLRQAFPFRNPVRIWSAAVPVRF